MPDPRYEPIRGPDIQTPEDAFGPGCNSTLNVRASSTDRGWLCAPSLQPGDPSVDPINDPAEMGSAFHEWSRTRDDADLTEIASRYDADVDELNQLVAYSLVAERELRKWFGDAAAEVSLSHTEPWDCPPYTHICLTGSVDRSDDIGESGAVLDYKTGRIESSHEHQQRTYAFLKQRDRPEITEVMSATVFVRLGFWRGRTYKVADLEAWWYDMKRRLANGLGTFSPGSHCGYCPRRPTCPGVAAYEQQALAFVSSPESGWTPAPELTIENKAIVGPEIADACRKVKYIKNRCDEFLEVLKARVLEIGDIPAGDGMKLSIVEQHRRKLDTMKAWPVLSAADLTDEEICEVCDISISKCQGLVADKAERGMKGVARKQLGDELEKAGAVTPNIIKQLREVAE